jgi:hypothetical protein
MKLLSLIQDDTGALSSMRVMTLIVVIPVMLVWTVLSIRQNVFVPMPVEMMGLIIAALGAKAAQSKFENLNP